MTLIIKKNTTFVYYDKEPEKKKYSLYKFTMFPIIPSFSYSLKF